MRCSLSWRKLGIHQEYCSKDQICEGTQQARVQVNLKLPGSTTETLWMSSLTTLQEMRVQVSTKFLAGEEISISSMMGLSSPQTSAVLFLMKPQYKLSA